MKKLLFFIALLILFSCKREDFSPTFSRSAFDHLDSVMHVSPLENLPVEEILLIENGWNFLGWDNNAGKVASVPMLLKTEVIGLPHRIPYANSNIWYANELVLDKGYLSIQADDGAQLWINGKQVFQNSFGVFPIENSPKEPASILIRVINNAVSGGLTRVFWVQKDVLENSINQHQKALVLKIQKAKEDLWTGENLPDNWADYPIWYNDPVIFPKGDDSLMLRWSGEKNVRAKLHYGHEPKMVLTTLDVLEENGIYSALVPAKKCHYFHFEINHTVSPLFKLESNVKTESTTFAVWADSQGGWDTFAKILQEIKIHNPEFTVGVGDLVGNGAKGWEYIRLQNELHQVPVPHYLLPGNHDYDGSYNNWIPENFNLYQKYKGEKNYQFWKKGPCVFIALDPNENFPVGIEKGSEQYDWFRKTISSKEWANAPWKIVFVHQPPFSQGWKGYQGEKSIQNLLKPYWESGLIDVVVSGHTHDYERLILPPNNDHQTAFLILGGAGGGIEPEKIKENYPQMDVLIRKHHFGWFEIDKDMLEFKAIDIEGKIIDSFVLKKEKKIL
jgi:hypothetical protein